MRIRNLTAILGAFLMLGLICSPVQAAEEWEIELAPLYFWGVDIDGDVTVRGQTAPLSMDTSEILDNLDFIFTAHLEARHESGWGFYVDPLFMDLGVPFDGPFGGGEVDLEMWMVEAMGMRRFGDAERYTDLIFGARYVSLDVHIETSTPLSPQGDKDWIDPLIGLRYGGEISPKWSGRIRADIGGFDVGSDLTWDAIVLFHYQLSERVALGFGYRHTDIDYDEGRGSELFELDAYMTGPLLGVNISF
jgi:hypothetical protein